MKVAVVAEWYPSPADPVHGIWAHRQALAARAAGAELRVLVLRRPVPPLSVARRLGRGDLGAYRAWSVGVRADREPWELDGLSVTPVRWLGPPRPVSYGSWGYWMAPALDRALRRLRGEWRFDLVHAHNVAPTGHAAAFWTRRSSVPLVVSAHGPDVIDIPTRSSVGRAAVATGLSRADLVLANSVWTARRCQDLARDGQVGSEIVHLGADLPGSARSPELGGIAAQPRPVRPRELPLRLVTVAHLQARKGHATVLRAIAALAPERRPEYLVIGAGEELERLQRLAAELGIADRVVFSGQLTHEAALARLTDRDLFVMPGVEETFGVAFIEAMAAGLVAIGGRGEGGPEDIVAAGPGMLTVEPGDVGELAGVIARLDGDREALGRLGAAAQRTVADNFSWEQCGQRTVAAYQRVLASRRATG